LKGHEIVRRRKNPDCDFYETPAWATYALLTRETFYGNIVEPASGNGAIVRTLWSYFQRKRGIISFDIRTDKGICGRKGVDFLKWTPKVTQPAHTIITNPPYRLAFDFAKHALKIAKYKVALLLRLTFLESAKRYKFFQESPLSTVYVFSSRVTMYPAGTEKPKNTGTAAYAWFVWDLDIPNRKPVIQWIAPHEEN